MKENFEMALKKIQKCTSGVTTAPTLWFALIETMKKYNEYLYFNHAISLAIIIRGGSI